MKSKPFSKLLQDALMEQQDNEVAEMIRLSESIGRFDGSDELGEFLCEGVMLNINTMAAQSLLIPPGKYMVTVHDAGHSVLVPLPSMDEDVTTLPKSYDIVTDKLIGVWNKLERVLGEDEERVADDDDFERKMRNKTVFNTKEPGRIHPIDQQVASSYSTTAMDQDEIASELGVHPSTVSRWKTKGKKSGRTPTLSHALELAHMTGVPVDAMLGNKTHNKGVARKKTGGSGGGRNEKYKQGSAGGEQPTSEDVEGGGR